MRKTVIALTTIAGVTLALGCMSFSFGGRTEVAEPHGPTGAPPGPVNTTSEHGSVRIPSGEEVTVYYPAPFASPPNLVIRDGMTACRITEQNADCFKIRNVGLPNNQPYEISWSARGVQMPSPAVPTAPTAPPPPTSPALANPVMH